MPGLGFNSPNIIKIDKLKKKEMKKNIEKRNKFEEKLFQKPPDPLPELTASSEAEIVTLHTGREFLVNIQQNFPQNLLFVNIFNLFKP